MRGATPATSTQRNQPQDEDAEQIIEAAGAVLESLILEERARLDSPEPEADEELPPDPEAEMTPSEAEDLPVEVDAVLPPEADEE